MNRGYHSESVTSYFHLTMTAKRNMRDLHKVKFPVRSNRVSSSTELTVGLDATYQRNHDDRNCSITVKSEEDVSR
jgi:hypothetical protein